MEVAQCGFLAAQLIATGVSYLALAFLLMRSQRRIEDELRRMRARLPYGGWEEEGKHRDGEHQRREDKHNG